MTDLPMDLVAGRYRIVRALGKGSFARTFLADDLRADRQVALKILDPAQASDWKTFELFEREADVLRALRHPGIPEVYDAFRAEWSGSAVHILALEYVAGESLAASIESKRVLDRLMVIDLFVELTGVLEYLHGRVPPILHRDIKPANIIVRPDGKPALVDFGSVRSVHRPDGGSTVAGTYGYMPYEQYMGQATPASDLYGLAATFLHLMTGSPPSAFITDGRIEVPPELGCGEPMASVLVKLLRPAPNDRFQSAREVRQALYGGTAVTALSAQAPGRLRPRRATISMPPGPRKIRGDLRALLNKVAPSTWRLLNATRNVAPVDVASLLLIGFFSVITAGVLPVWFWSISASRRRRAKVFFARGVLADATVLGMELEDIGFSEKLSRVRYEFEADGRLVRASDSIVPAVAERWHAGDTIQVLYLPDQDDDSIIVSTN